MCLLYSHTTIKKSCKPNDHEDVFITPENERNAIYADAGGASIANDVLITITITATNLSNYWETSVTETMI